jgi:hypothetical protein
MSNMLKGPTTNDSKIKIMDKLAFYLTHELIDIQKTVGLF